MKEKLAEFSALICDITEHLRKNLKEYDYQNTFKNNTLHLNEEEHIRNLLLRCEIALDSVNLPENDAEGQIYRNRSVTVAAKNDSFTQNINRNKKQSNIENGSSLSPNEYSDINQTKQLAILERNTKEMLSPQSSKAATLSPADRRILFDRPKVTISDVDFSLQGNFYELYDSQQAHKNVKLVDNKIFSIKSNAGKSFQSISPPNILVSKFNAGNGQKDSYCKRTIDFQCDAPQSQFCPYRNFTFNRLHTSRQINQSSKMGYLYKIERKFLFDQIKKFYCSIIDQCLLCYDPNSSETMMSISASNIISLPGAEIDEKSRPTYCIHLYDKCIEHYGDGKKRELTFIIFHKPELMQLRPKIGTSPDTTTTTKYIFQCNTEIETKQWIHTIEAAIRGEFYNYQQLDHLSTNRSVSLDDDNETFALNASSALFPSSASPNQLLIDNLKQISFRTESFASFSQTNDVSAMHQHANGIMTKSFVKIKENMDDVEVMQLRIPRAKSLEYIYEEPKNAVNGEYQSDDTKPPKLPAKLNKVFSNMQKFHYITNSDNEDYIDDIVIATDIIDYSCKNSNILSITQDLFYDIPQMNSPQKLAASEQKTSDSGGKSLHQMNDDYKKSKFKEKIKNVEIKLSQSSSLKSNFLHHRVASAALSNTEASIQTASACAKINKLKHKYIFHKTQSTKSSESATSCIGSSSTSPYLKKFLFSHRNLMDVNSRSGASPDHAANNKISQQDAKEINRLSKRNETKRKSVGESSKVNKIINKLEANGHFPIRNLQV